MARLTSYSLCGPDPAPMTVEEVDALKSLVAALPETPVIFQIGADIGVSTLAVLEARPDAFVFSIDIGRCPKEREHLLAAGLPTNRVVRLLGRSQDIGRFWPDHLQCDLLYIDGDHREGPVAEDVEAWVPLVKPGGIVAFHDYVPDPPPRVKSRVAKVVDGKMRGYEEILWIGRLKAFRQR